jgi:hypothetical protein
MHRHPPDRRIRDTWRKLRRLFRFKRPFEREGPGSPGDPYAYVTAPKKPRPPLHGAAVAEEEP